VLLDLVHLAVGFLEIALLHLRDDHVGNTDGDRSTGGILESLGLDEIEHLGRSVGSVDLDAFVDDDAKFLLAHHEIHFIVEGGLRVGAIHIAQVLRNGLVEDDFSGGGLDDPGLQRAIEFLLHTHTDAGMQGDNRIGIGHQCLVRAGEGLAFTWLLLCDVALGIPDAFLFHREVIRTEDHVLCRNGDRLAVLRLQQVVGREHQETGFRLRLGRQRNVDGHLVAVEVGVVGGTDQRMQLDGAAFDQNRFKGLDAEAVQRRRAVEQHRMVLDDILEGVPDFGFGAVHHARAS
jgi:hypothetical protein